MSVWGQKPQVGTHPQASGLPRSTDIWLPGINGSDGPIAVVLELESITLLCGQTSTPTKLRLHASRPAPHPAPAVSLLTATGPRSTPCTRRHCRASRVSTAA